ncbi:GntR family transcriptional regulator [Prosthecomicrobium pneumaticum]|uniref:DNA-binding GntR family transcriptional regulator n=1 Tax=Prosthecomicrobium pneumaticum TaxID=81895 RepID=A0A7W9FJ71_9HYPH|nr:GntR family transcriptional regulator [Prosthecomicrobium pneumaticum]MBB5751422.1 DNA-binding GntR family transcriptional regulator [Prosthecomicrobium pneumaticum]
MAAGGAVADDLSLRVQSLPGLREQVTERLRTAIATGRFPPGARLVERELCALLGVSRTSLREALRELQADGLVTLQPNKGLSVAIVTAEIARSIYEVRAMLEGLAARLFARNASAAQIAAIGASVERLADIYAAFDAEAFIAAKAEFYEILLEGAGNPVAADMLRRVHTRVSQLRVVSVSSPERAAQSLAELRAFVAALAARDEQRAWQLCLAHVKAAAEAALKVIRAGQA